ncbi:hypothetical protein [uncultured Methylobacterium sp.]|uniref:hypothetical protein n=1 Tax=uncultured Methylobacterium sp. TaxID=157278 RepID=UPI002593936F|nr:hypothetical protein [uncultured Methylobacterium sp.]
MFYRVLISNDALGSMALAAIEAYCRGDGRPTGRKGLETLGYVWGHKKISDDSIIYNVSKISVSLSATRHRDWVRADPEAGDLKNSFMERWSPELSLLGDFHTHPYASIDEVKEVSGFEFSDADFKSLESDDWLWEKTGNAPLMLAITICRVQRVHLSQGDQVRNNVGSFSVGEFRFWVNAAVGSLDGEERTCTGNKRSPVFLDLHSRFFNLASDRIERRLEE